MRLRELEGKDMLSKRIILEFDPNNISDCILLKDMFELCLMHRRVTQESATFATSIVDDMNIQIDILSNPN